LYLGQTVAAPAPATAHHKTNQEPLHHVNTLSTTQPLVLIDDNGQVSVHSSVESSLRTVTDSSNSVVNSGPDVKCGSENVASAATTSATTPHFSHTQYDIDSGSNGGKLKDRESYNELHTHHAQVLECIATLPGYLHSRRSLSHLHSLARQYPETFTSRTLYLTVQNLLLENSFSLEMRRDVLALFPVTALFRNSNALSVVSTTTAQSYDADELYKLI